MSYAPSIIKGYNAKTGSTTEDRTYHIAIPNAPIKTILLFVAVRKIAQHAPVSLTNDIQGMCMIGLSTDKTQQGSVIFRANLYTMQSAIVEIPVNQVIPENTFAVAVFTQLGGTDKVWFNMVVTT